MKERPILFSGPMVRALLDGSKTQTRRVVKPQPEVDKHGHLGGEWLSRPLGGLVLPELQDITIHCPYGQPGDRLWVRETFYCDHCFYPNGTPPSCYWDGDKPRTAHTPEQLLQERADMLESMYYRADGEPEWEGAESPTVWRPSIHMPRWASRITLEVTGVRVERLQDISEGDAIAEGWPKQRDPGTDTGGNGGPFDWYRALWNEINGADAWAANPWVWVVEFRRLP